MLEVIQDMRDELLEARRTHKSMGTSVPKELASKATGNCYSLAGSYIMDNPKSGTVLVHGRPTLQIPPFIEFGHAWIEIGDKIFDPQSGYRGDRMFYYSLGQIDHRNNLVYTPKQAMAFMASHGHFGPWQGPDGTGMTSRQKKRWKDMGRKPPRRTRKSKSAGFELPPEIAARLAELEKPSKGRGFRPKAGKAVRGSLGKPTKAFGSVPRSKQTRIFMARADRGRPVKVAV